MKLVLPDESQMVKETFERFFADNSTSARIRDAELAGFDQELWRELLGLEVPFMRVSGKAGGGDMGLFDACIMMEQAGRRLASVPLAEALVALRIIGETGGDAAARWLAEVRDGAFIAMALRPGVPVEEQLVPGGSAAKAVLSYDGKDIAIETPPSSLSAPETLVGASLASWRPGEGQREVLASGEEAARIWAAGLEEWKLLISSALIGLSDEALSMAAAYASERVAFGQPIGANQSLAHPLADDIIAVDGARMTLWWTLKAIERAEPEAGSDISFLYWWAARTATLSVAHSIHTFGGYGLTNEYDIQLYHRRAKAWPLAYGDPEDELLTGARRRILNEPSVLPETGVVEIDFDPPAGDEAVAKQTQTLLESVLDPEKHVLHDHSFEGHNTDVNKVLGEAALLYPDWPTEWGGRGVNEATTRASRAAALELGYMPPSIGTTSMVGWSVMKFGSQELKEEVLPLFARGETTAALGYTEPSGGSDVFAAKTRAVRDGDHWIINGQKMFTSGAEHAGFVFLLARTDPDAPKHKGLTLFLVPLNSPGVEIQPVHTFMDERTNATFYSDVRIPDRYRVGDVNGGVTVMSHALTLEQSGGRYYDILRNMIARVEDWARGWTREGHTGLEDPRLLLRLGRVHAQANVAECLFKRVTGYRLANLPDLAYGPASKVFSTETFITDSADLLDLAAPASLVRGKEGLGLVEISYRHSTATTIYAGTSEVLRSMVAERRLGLPRSRA